MLDNPYGNIKPHFVIDDVMNLQKQQIQLQHITNETLLVQIQKEQNTNALLAERLSQAEEHNKELQEKLDAEIAKNDKAEKRYIPKEIFIILITALICFASKYIFDFIVSLI